MDRLLQSCLRHLSGGAHSGLRPRAGQFARSAMGPASRFRFVLPPAVPNGASSSIPSLSLVKSYMNGTFVVEEGTIADVLAICLGQESEVPHWARLQGLLRYLRRRLSQFNPRPRARRNVAHHYDLDGRLYSLFLDADRQYSCAYFEKLDQSLDDAQLAKKRHLAAKLQDAGRTSSRSFARVLTSAAAGAGSVSISPKSAKPT